MENTYACVLGPWPWPRAFLSLASRVSVLGKAVLGLGFFLCPWPWPRALCPRLHLCFSPQKMSVAKSSLTIRGERINRTPVAKYLGLLIDEKLKFDLRVKHVCKKIVTNVRYILLSAIQYL